MAYETLTRKELYDLVWSTPFSILSKKYSISDVGLKKKCKRMEIPTPIAGHWAKVKAKMPVDIIKLSTNYLGDQKVILKIRNEEEDRIKKLPSPTYILTQEIENTMAYWLVVPEKLTKPHKLISIARNRITKKRANVSGGLVTTQRGEFPIKVSPENVNHALLFLDTFIKLLLHRGHVIISKNDSVYLVVDGEEMEVSLKEGTKSIPIAGKLTWPTHETIATGVLNFRIKDRYHTVYGCTDSGECIPKSIAYVMASLEIGVQQIKKDDIEREEKRIIEEKKMKIARELLDRKEKELANFKQLLNDAKRWNTAELVRSYLNSIESKCDSTEELKEQIVWGRMKADWYDPQINSEDELLNNVNKETLTFIKKSWWE